MAYVASLDSVLKCAYECVGIVVPIWLIAWAGSAGTVLWVRSPTSLR